MNKIAKGSKKKMKVLKQFIRKVHFLILVLLFLVTGYLTAQAETPLTLPEAEHIAIAISPELQRLQATSQALKQDAIADDQLPDPKFMAGAIDVPTNTFSFNQDDMTMVQVGLEQSFPAGHSLAMKSRQTQALSKAEQRKNQAQAIMLLQNVRETWLDLYYWIQAGRVIHTNQALLTYLLKSTKSQYSVGKNSLSDVLQIQLELSALDNQSVQIEQQIDSLRAQLGEWIGQDQASRPLAFRLPNWPNPPSLTILQDRLQQHPLLKVDAADIEAARAAVGFAKEQFKPGFTVDVDYGIRQGNMMGSNGMPTSRSNMLTAEVTMDLPVFAKNRQSRRLQASNDQLVATQLEQQTHYRDLLKELTTQYALWQRLSQREMLYTRKILPESQQNSKAALLAYQSATTDLATVLRAYTNARNIQLEQLQIQVARTKARAALLYLEGMTG